MTLLTFFLLAMSVAVKNFLVMTVCAFIAFISFIQINSAASDKHKLHWFWRILGFVFALAAVWFLTRVMKNSN